MESLLAAYAVTRRDAARVQAGTALPEPVARSQTIMLDMASVFARREIDSAQQQSTFDPAIASLSLLTILETTAPGADTTLRDQLGAMLVSLHRRGEGLLDPQAPVPPAGGNEGGEGGVGDGVPMLNAPTTALAAAALATLHAQTRDPEAGRVARDLADTLAAGMVGGGGRGG